MAKRSKRCEALMAHPAINDLLAGVDADALEDFARRIRAWADTQERIGHTLYVEDQRIVAAVLRAVANAERALKADDMLTVDAFEGLFRCWRATEMIDVTNNHPTLAAALAAVCGPETTDGQ